MPQMKVIRMIVNNLRKVINLENTGFLEYIHKLLNVYPRVIHKLGITCGYVDLRIYTYAQ